MNKSTLKSSKITLISSLRALHLNQENMTLLAAEKQYHFVFTVYVYKPPK